MTKRHAMPVRKYILAVCAMTCVWLMQLNADPFCFLEQAPARKRWVFDTGGSGAADWTEPRLGFRPFRF